MIAHNLGCKLIDKHANIKVFATTLFSKGNKVKLPLKLFPAELTLFQIHITHQNAWNSKLDKPAEPKAMLRLWLNTYCSGGIVIERSNNILQVFLL